LRKIIFIFFLFVTSVSLNAATGFSPDVGVTGEFNIFRDSSSGQYLPGVGPLEVSFLAPVDPYSSAFVILSHHQGQTEVEEAYLKISSLPFALQAKVGRMRVDFNHLNQIHVHEFPFINYPQYLNDFFSSDGLIKNGAEVGWLLPLDFYSEIKAQWLSGDADNSFALNQNILGFKWKNFFEIGESGGLEIGLSRLQGTNHSGLTPTDNFKTEITGFNLRYKQVLGPDQYLVFNNEWLWSASDYAVRVNSTGSFYYAGYQMNKYWQWGLGIP
jgi:hypothetical protein